MNAEIVAEGVETDAQLNAVMRDQQINHIQGYHLGYPMDREQIREKIAIFASAKQGEVVLFEKRTKPDLPKRLLARSEAKLNVDFIAGEPKQ